MIAHGGGARGLKCIFHLLSYSLVFRNTIEKRST